MDIDRPTLNFLEALNREKSLRDELAAALEGVEDRLGRTVQFAAEKGYAVTTGTLEAAKQALMAVGGRDGVELSDGALDQVAGGFNPQPDPPGSTTPSQLTLNPKLSKQILW